MTLGVSNRLTNDWLWHQSAESYRDGMEKIEAANGPKKEVFWSFSFKRLS